MNDEMMSDVHSSTSEKPSKKQRTLLAANEANVRSEEASATIRNDRKQTAASKIGTVADTSFLNQKYNDAVTQSRGILVQLEGLLQDPKTSSFCSRLRRCEWSNEISTLQSKSTPNVTIGCLGVTGVGKSSMLNALLDEASILPTSGSRGCTAAVVELRYNRDLLNITDKTAVYKGQVEFMSQQEWHDELKVLLEECCPRGSDTIYSQVPQEQRNAEATAAWTTIDQVYGPGTMKEHLGVRVSEVLDALSRNEEVNQVLKGLNGSANTILIEEGDVDAVESKHFLGHLANLKGKRRRIHQQWAKNFRSKINGYVYRRKGNGRQDWPLIRKVVLYGPWEVLSTGACLVDLPGVRDANSARAKVAQSYLQNCDAIWIVAGITRAVDDGTARELLGEEFKRRLLMDGQYGKVSFICTRCDECEATEILEDHKDVAELVDGRWEQMMGLKDQMDDIDKQRNDTHHQEENVMAELEDAELAVEDLQNEIDEAEEAVKADEELGVSLEKKKQEAEALRTKLRNFRNTMDEHKDKYDSLQKHLKSIAAVVRNEFSTSRLQEDFRVGLEELIHQPDDEDIDDGKVEPERTNESPLPDDFKLEVHCVSSNDYLKLLGIKPRSDGPPNTFASIKDTQIPSLRMAVHETTKRFQIFFATSYLNKCCNLIDRFRLCAAGGESADDKYRKVFQHEVSSLDSTLDRIKEDFSRKSQIKVEALKRSIQSGAHKSGGSGVKIAASWGSEHRRSKHQRNLQVNGLYWNTYNAAIRRSGNFTSTTAGVIKLNQELCDPMEKHFSVDWQRGLDAGIKNLLKEAEKEVGNICVPLVEAITTAFAGYGMESAHLALMGRAATGSIRTCITDSFKDIRKTAATTQRTLSRSLEANIAQQMSAGYAAALAIPPGLGSFNRQKDVLEGYVRSAGPTMFNDAAKELEKSIDKMLSEIASMIYVSSQSVKDRLESVYSECWGGFGIDMTLECKAKIAQTRATVLPILYDLRHALEIIMENIGLDHERIERDALPNAEEETPMDSTDNRVNGDLMANDAASPHANLPSVFSSPTNVVPDAVVSRMNQTPHP